MNIAQTIRSKMPSTTAAAVKLRGLKLYKEALAACKAAAMCDFNQVSFPHADYFYIKHILSTDVYEEAKTLLSANGFGFEYDTSGFYPYAWLITWNEHKVLNDANVVYNLMPSVIRESSIDVEGKANAIYNELIKVCIRTGAGDWSDVWLSDIQTITTFIPALVLSVVRKRLEDEGFTTSTVWRDDGPTDMKISW